MPTPPPPDPRSLLRIAVECLLGLIRSTHINDFAVLVAADDLFEITRVPSLVLVGPVLEEDLPRRTLEPILEKDLTHLTYDEITTPLLYHLIFEVILTTASEGELIDLMERWTAFYQDHLTLTLTDSNSVSRGILNLTEMVALGDQPRVNLSNFQQASGKFRLEDCPIWPTEIRHGKLIRDRTFQWKDGPVTIENQTLGPTDG